MSNIQHIPLAQLRISPRNARKTGGLAIDDLAASIAAEGLLQNLVVTAANDGHYDVEAGGRRLRALQLLQSEDRLPDALASVPCHVVSDDVAGEASLAENAIREAMHPADQFDAFKALVDAGRRISEVAARFGVSELFVKQRLRLARVRPEFLDMYKADEITLDQLQALATTDNHEIQRQAWHTAREWERDPRSLRNFITRERVSSTSVRATFVGLHAYQAAGGELVQDLFSSQCWLSDPQLLDRLALEKLQAKAEALRAEGWSWVDPVLSIDHATLNEHRALPEPENAPTVYANPSHEARVAEIEARLREIDDIDEDDLDDEQADTLTSERCNLEDELNDIYAEATVEWPAALKSISGVIVTIDHSGQFDLYYGRLQPGQKISKSGSIGAPPPGSSAEPTKPPKKPELSEALRIVLSGHRSAAAAVQLAKDPTLAHCVLLEQLLISHWPVRYGNNGLFVSIERDSGTMLRAVGGADIHKALQAALAERTAIIKQVPQKGTLDFLLKQTDAWRLELQAALVAAHFSGISGSEQGHAGVDAIHRITGFDMADHWTPASDGFLARIHGDLVTEAVVEAKGKAEATTLTGLKKADRAAQAGKLLAGTGWLPKLLRGPGYGKKPAQTVAKAAPKKATKPTATKKPAKKAAPKKAAKTPAKKAAKKAAKKGAPA
ncbi:hypothetical protein CSC62_07385 [Pseudoxanthomonas jiangsuensis]|uniref:ParB/RepB/Spo0J family partition protein n=1 Tax=Pseudoxanthomonas jiangsuensis TaxID=619688 RepID=UPI001391F3D4|nr:ParB/RepB/Spo0J family partition protein [Pseudoxanthomonas jiangsuensis]KAF1697961.1 hypothetical protein CSC62_07385 [Pseudoxanthomonas jiangsuensis]